MGVTDKEFDSHSEHFNLPNVKQLGIHPPMLHDREQTLLYWPDKHLSEECLDVTTFDLGTHQVIYDLVYTMLSKKGIGIAAPQIGWMLNIIIIEQVLKGLNTPIALINPKIVKTTDKELFTTNEGCLSVPGYYEERGRPSGVVVEYRLPNGKKTKTEFRGLNAFVVQHEIEHLEGKVFVDSLSKFKKGRVLKKIKKTRSKGG